MNGREVAGEREVRTVGVFDDGRDGAVRVGAVRTVKGIEAACDRAGGLKCDLAMLVDGRARKGALVEVVALVVGDNHEAVLARKSGHG